MKKEVQRAKPITKAVALKVLEVVDQGLSSGLGREEPGAMCVEAAVCYAMGEPHNDMPKCVMPLIRDVKININDNHVWQEAALDRHDNYDKKAARVRSNALRRLAIAQLGSKGKITAEAWRKAVTAYIGDKLNNRPDMVAEKKAAIKDLEKALFAVKAGKHVDVQVEYCPHNDNDYDSDVFCALDVTTIKDAKKVCEDIVQILVKLKSPGTKFLYLTEKAKPKAKGKKRVVKDIRKAKRKTK